MHMCLFLFGSSILKWNLINYSIIDMCVVWLNIKCPQILNLIFLKQLGTYNGLFYKSFGPFKQKTQDGWWKCSVSDENHIRFIVVFNARVNFCCGQSEHLYFACLMGFLLSIDHCRRFQK